MYEKIEGKEIMTKRAAMLKYRTKYFLMVITEIVGGDRDLGYVIFTADSKRELYKAPYDGYRNLRLSSMLGVAAEPYSLLGNIEYHGAV